MLNEIKEAQKENTTWSQENTTWFHLHKVFDIVNVTEAENRMVVFCAGEKEERVITVYQA